MGLLDSIILGRCVDPVLGLLVCEFGRWRGQITLGAAASAVPLILSVWRSAPD